MACPQRALVAGMHKLAIAVGRVLHDNVEYKGLGADHFGNADLVRRYDARSGEANAWV